MLSLSQSQRPGSSQAPNYETGRLARPRNSTFDSPRTLYSLGCFHSLLTDLPGAALQQGQPPHPLPTQLGPSRWTRTGLHPLSTGLLLLWFPSCLHPSRLRGTSQHLLHLTWQHISSWYVEKHPCPPQILGIPASEICEYGEFHSKGELKWQMVASQMTLNW